MRHTWEQSSADGYFRDSCIWSSISSKCFFAVAILTVKWSSRWPWPPGLKSTADLMWLRLRFLRVFKLDGKWRQFKSWIAWTRLTSQVLSWRTLIRELELAPYMMDRDQDIGWDWQEKRSPEKYLDLRFSKITQNLTHIWQLWNAIPWIRDFSFAPATVRVPHVRHSANNSAKSSIVREGSYKYKRGSSPDAIIQNERNTI